VGTGLARQDYTTRQAIPLVRTPVQRIMPQARIAWKVFLEYV
jgi:hypothetical protein